MRRAATPGLLCALLAACAAAEPRGLLEGGERRVLENGLSVVVVEDRRLPTVTALLAYRVGSADEEPGATGLSHFFEHMVFKGTEKYGKGEIDRTTYRCGGVNNAFTTRDVTGYWFRVGAEYLDNVLAILADTMENCTLDAREFELERRAVLQEMDRWLDGPWGKLQRALDQAAYGADPYSHPVMGWRTDVERLSRKQMVDFYRRAYRPDNASLVIVGNVDAADAFRKAAGAFGPLRAEAPEVPPPDALVRTRSTPKVSVATGGEIDRFVLAWRAAPAGSDADLTLDLIATILGEGRSSRLNRRLVERDELAAEGNVEARNASRRRGGLFTIRAELALGAGVEETRRAVLAEVERLKTEPVEPRELRRAKNLRRAQFVFGAESQVALATTIGYFDALGVPGYTATYLERIEAITPERILACARSVFREENRTLAIGDPRRARRRSGAGRPGGADAFGPVRTARLENGLTVLVQRRSELPIVAIQAAVRAGRLVEPAEKAGVARLTGELLDEGTRDRRGRRRTGADLADEIEFVGGRLATGPGGVAVQVLSPHAALALDRLADLLQRPTFPADQFRKLRRDRLAELGAMDDDPAWTARRLFRAAAYGDHPMGRPGAGTVATVRRLTREDVVAHYRRFYRPENVVVAIAGDLEPERAVQMVRTRFRAWKRSDPWEPPEAERVERVEAPKRIVRTHPSNQVRIHMGHVGIARNDPDYPALRVMETILCTGPGLANRLAREVRDARGLAYDVTGSITSEAGEAAGPFQIVMGVAPEDAERAVDVVREVIRTFLEKGPTAEEVEDARRYLLATFPTAWETAGDRASYMLKVHRYGLGDGYAARFRRAISEVDPETVRRAARKHLDLERFTTIMVGPVRTGSNSKEGDDRR